jgi:contactin associated protein-like 2
LIIDLGATKNITRIAIQGRPHHSEYVSEFSISYGYNGLDYADYKEPGGNTKVKENNAKEIKWCLETTNMLYFF